MKRKSRRTENGLATIEILLLLAVASIALAGIFFAYNRIPRPQNHSAATKAVPSTPEPKVKPADDTPSSSSSISPLVISLFGSLLASVAWNTKQLFGNLTNRAQLRIIEALSLNASTTAHFLKSTVRKKATLLGLFPEVIDDALLTLFMAGKVTIAGGKDSLTKEAETPEDSSHASIH